MPRYCSIICGTIARMWIRRASSETNGGSGGGTHTVLLTVLDDRITAAAPTVNLASHFDGGCPCESGKPIQLAGHGTCNAELMAFFAPKPLLVVSDGGDWTASVRTLEYPYLQYIYNMYSAKDRLPTCICLRNVNRLWHQQAPGKLRFLHPCLRFGPQ